MASQITVRDRFNDPGYKNYLKLNQSLVLLRNGLTQFTEKEMKTFHTSLLSNRPLCGVCTNKTNTFCKDCSNWKADIVKVMQNAGRNGINVHWANSEVKKWPVSPWEVAKLFMGRGQKPTNVGPDSSDCSNLLILISNYKPFKKLLSKFRLINELTGERNKLMHSATLSVDAADVVHVIGKMIELLKDKAFTNDAKAAEAIQRLEEVRDAKLEVVEQDWLNIELDTMQQRLSTLENNLATQASPEDKKLDYDALNKTIDFVTQHQELADQLSKELSETSVHLLELSKRVDMVENVAKKKKVPTATLR